MSSRTRGIAKARAACGEESKQAVLWERWPAPNHAPPPEVLGSGDPALRSPGTPPSLLLSLPPLLGGSPGCGSAGGSCVQGTLCRDYRLGVPSASSQQGTAPLRKRTGLPWRPGLELLAPNSKNPKIFHLNLIFQVLKKVYLPWKAGDVLNVRLLSMTSLVCAAPLVLLALALHKGPGTGTNCQPQVPHVWTTQRLLVLASRYPKYQ